MSMKRNGLPFYVRIRGLLLLDLVCLGVALWLAFQWRYGATTIEDPNVLAFRRTFLVLLPLRVFLYALFGLYRTDLDESLLDLLYRVFWVCLIISVLEWLILSGINIYYLREMGISRKLIFSLWPAWFFLAVSVRWVTGWLRQRIRASQTRIVLVGSGRIEPVLYSEVNELVRPGGMVIGFVGDELDLPDDRFEILGTLDELPQVLKTSRARQVVVVDDGLARERLSWLLGHCEAQGVVLRILPSLYEIMIGRIRIARAGGIPLVEVIVEPLTPVQRFLKRALDIGFALVAFVALFWVWLLIGILIKLDLQGPVLERLPCLGWKGRRFNLLRFRTTVSASPGVSEPLSLTPIGYLLQRLDFDRIPQLLNVLAGDLSLVGPRPMTPDFLEAILREEPLYRHCLKVKPGVTGLAQIHGQRHHLRSKLRYDLSYINNCSLLLDLKILFQSFSVLITGRKIRA